MNGKAEHTNKRMKRPQGGLQTQQGACGCKAGAFPCLHGEEGRKEGREAGAGCRRAGGVQLPSVLVLLLLYMFRRLPTRFSFHALRLAASREQRGQGGKRQQKGKENK